MHRISRVYKDMYCMRSYRFTVQRGKMENTRRHDLRNYTAWPPTARYVLLCNFIREHDLRPREEFLDGVYILEFWREAFLAYCRERRIACGAFDFGFEDGVVDDPNLTQQRPEPATPDRG